MKKKRKIISLLLVLSLLLSVPAVQSDAKTKTPKLVKKKITIYVGVKKEVKSKNVKKTTKVKIIQSKKAKKIAKVTWSKKKKVLSVKGKKKGKTSIKVRFKMKTNKTKKAKWYTSKLSITVNTKAIASPRSSANANNNSVRPTPTATVTSSTEPTASQSAEPTPILPLPEMPTYTGEYSGDEEPALKDVYQKYFLMGAAINGSSTTTMALNHKGMTGILLKHFNSTVMSNLMKPEHLLDQEKTKQSADGMPVCKFDTCDSALKFCLDNGIKMRGHTLVWHNQAPDWFFYEDYDTSKKLVDAETMEKRMESYIKQVLTHCQTNFPGVIYCWDVVNECVCTDANSYVITEGGWKLRSATKQDNDFTHDEAKANFWYATMGEGYVEKAFRYARKYADPDVKLFYNDYNPFMTEKMNNIYMMCDELKQKGLIDGIGLQPTVLIDWPELNTTNSGSFRTCLQKYSELGLEIQITELSFELRGISNPTENHLHKQAERYEEFMRLLLEMDSDNNGPCNITSVTVFGICDDYPLYENHKQNLYLWTKDCEPKECFYSYLQPGLELYEKAK